jgi:hypothetical protein
MKFEVEIEATPAEARAFLGLPDLTPLHDAWVERMKQYTLEGPSSEDWQKLMQTWTSGVPGVSEGFEAWQKLMFSAMTPKAGKAADKKG